VEVTYGPREKTIIVAFIGTGELFGEIGFLDRQSRIRTLRAMEDTTIRTWTQMDMARMQSQDPVLYGAFITLLAKSICVKFRRILDEREPLEAYAAALSAGRRSFQESQTLPVQAFQSLLWPNINQMVESFKDDFFELSLRLQENTGRNSETSIQKQCDSMLDRFNGRLEDIRLDLAGQELEGPFWGYVFKEIFPYFMRSRFAERAYYKPKGYAGDYQMMEMLYHQQPRGDGLLGALVDSWCLDTAAARAFRGRRILLKGLLQNAAARRANPPRPLRILNLACGSCRELFDFLAETPRISPLEALCIDTDAGALEFIHHHVNVIPHQAVIRLMQADVLRWIGGRDNHPFGEMDFIYSAGLIDYLEDGLVEKLVCRSYEHLRPGGVLALGNFGPANPNRAFMDHILQWKLIHRSPEQLRTLTAGIPFQDGVDVLAGQEGVNLFLVARKPEKG
jgi:CRP-like cAMP-binding protein